MVLVSAEPMMDEIRRRFRAVQYEYSLHAVDQSIPRHITRNQVEEAVANGEIIEDYPTDKYGASCLILGFTVNPRLHCRGTPPPRTVHPSPPAAGEDHHSV